MLICEWHTNRIPAPIADRGRSQCSSGLVAGGVVSVRGKDQKHSAFLRSIRITLRQVWLTAEVAPQKKVIRMLRKKSEASDRSSEEKAPGATSPDDDCVKGTPVGYQYQWLTVVVRKVRPGSLRVEFGFVRGTIRRTRFHPSDPYHPSSLWLPRGASPGRFGECKARLQSTSRLRSTRKQTLDPSSFPLHVTVRNSNSPPCPRRRRPDGRARGVAPAAENPRLRHRHGQLSRRRDVSATTTHCSST
jgi:hypothetical protein